MEISKIIEDDAGRYQWTVTGPAWDNTARDIIPDATTAYRTNTEGRGLWVWAPANSTWHADGSPVMEWRQVLGTSQFNLNGSRQTRRSRVVRYFAERE